MKIALIGNTAWGLINFRAGLMRSLIVAGHHVVAVAPNDEHAVRITALGVRFLGMPMDNKGTHPVKDLRLLFDFIRLFQKEKPDLVISYTIKPVIYATIAARWMRIPSVSVITGLGTVFLRENLLTKLVEWLYRFSQSHAKKVFFLNEDDMQVFLSRKLSPSNSMAKLPSEGVDVGHFNLLEQDGTLNDHCASRSQRPFHFLLMARMLWDKGIGEYVDAAREVRKHFPSTEFGLLGFLDVKNPSAISRVQMDEWVKEGVVNYLGVTDDVRQAVTWSDCVVLPSYREGIPRTLLEASAMGRPIVATDTVGCRDVVEDGVNGFLCRTRDAEDLANKLMKILSLSPVERQAMGAKGRKKVEAEFDERIVIQYYMEVISDVAANRNFDRLD
jgi:glycosyltransferase involved in cell wall biosynthesis